jgi:hypothetical protein
MFKFDKKDLLEHATVADVYKYVDHYDLFRHYLGEFTLGRTMLSPLLKESRPSFAVFAVKNGLRFKDFRLGGGDIIEFIKLRDNVDLQTAINTIVYDAGLGDKFNINFSYPVKPLVVYNKKIEVSRTTVNVKRRPWNQLDIDFWDSYGISKDTLLQYRVSPIKYIFLNNKIIVADKYAYCFVEQKDGLDTFTIYQPFNKRNKWFKSHDASVFYGWSQLPETGETLIITKSMKDVMTIAEIIKLPTIAMQSESTIPKQHIIDELQNRFKNVYILYDNDYDNINKDKANYGREFGKKLADEFNLIQIEIPDDCAIKFDAKDVSDLAKNANKEQVINIIMNEITNNNTPSSVS